MIQVPSSVEWVVNASPGKAVLDYGDGDLSEIPGSGRFELPGIIEDLERSIGVVPQDPGHGKVLLILPSRAIHAAYVLAYAAFRLRTHGFWIATTGDKDPVFVWDAVSAAIEQRIEHGEDPHA
ncbi:MAG: hypothetical protein D6775_08120 [Caldilineae bacterium]|nr:MAG: hypothetical protein D6775_08120 [Caldilineae bacterium]